MYIHTCIHTHMHANVYTYMLACMYAYISQDDAYDPLNSGGDDDILDLIGDNNKCKIANLIL